MKTICITGHRPDAFLVSHYDEDTVKRIADDVVCVLKREYGSKLCFNLGGAIGVDQWVGAAAINHGARFALYLPFLPQIQAKFWNQEQRQELDRQLRHASRIVIAEGDAAKYDPGRYHERDRLMVDAADIVVSFWVGRRRGGTYGTMKYALSKSMLVLNALDDLRPVFKQTLVDGWTPSHIA